MKILCVGDIVAGPGRRLFKTVAKRLRESGEVSAIVVNAENAAHGRGITGEIVKEILADGADAITLGDHVWDQKDAPLAVEAERRVARPANCPAGCPGRGWTSFKTDIGDVVVVNLQGRVFMNPSDCPFAKIDELLAGPIPRNAIVLADFHAEATSEKIAMGWHLDGRISALYGTHTHVQTSDAKVLPQGTGYITDLGMTGPANSIIGREVAPVLRKFRTGMPSTFDIAGGPSVLEGCVFDIDRATRKCKSAVAVRFHETN